MRALVITEHGPPEVLRVQERPDPVPGPGQVRVGVRAAGINFADLMARVGLYPDAPTPPCVVGYEVAGEVESLGDGVEGFEPGQRVMGGCRFGGYAELAVTGASERAAAARRLELRGGRRAAGRLRDRLRRARPLRRPARGRAGADPRGGRRRGHRRHADRASCRAPRSSAPRRRPSTTRSAASGSTTRSTTARRTWSTRSAASPASRAARPRARRASAGAASSRATRCCGPAAGWSASAPPRSRPASGAAAPARCACSRRCRASTRSS